MRAREGKRRMVFSLLPKASRAQQRQHVKKMVWYSLLLLNRSPEVEKKSTDGK